MKKTLYDIFEVNPDASPETVRNAYKSLVQRHHPDKNQGDPYAEEVLKAINFAYGVLSDPMKRLAYDASLAAMQGAQSTATPLGDSAYRQADARHQYTNEEGVPTPEAVAPDVNQTVQVPAQPKGRLVTISLLALLLVGGVLVMLLRSGDGQDEVSSLTATQHERKLDSASGNQAVPAPRSVTETNPTADRQTPKITHSDDKAHTGTQPPQKNVTTAAPKPPVTEPLAKTAPAPRPFTEIIPAPDRQAAKLAHNDNKERPSTQVPQQDVAAPREPHVIEPLAKAEVVVAPTPISKQSNVVAPAAKIPPAPLPNTRASAEPSEAKPKDAAHPAPQQLAVPQVKTSESGKKPTSERGETKQQSIPPEQFSLQAEELPDKAVAKKDPMAQYKKGLMYEKGQDLPQDFSQAAHWYRQAAEQGIADAQYRLGKLYTVGKGVPIDNVEAYVWLSLAAAGNVDAAKPVVDYLASTMTPEQLAKAKGKAAAVRARHKR